MYAEEKSMLIRRMLCAIALLTGAVYAQPTVPLTAEAALGPYVITTICQQCTSGGMNDFGQVVAGTIAPGPITALLWTPLTTNGVSETLVKLPGLQLTELLGCVASRINARGQVVGLNILTQGGPPVWLWNPASPNGTTGTTTAIPLLGVSPVLINDFGQVATEESIWTPSPANSSTGTITLTSPEIVDAWASTVLAKKSQLICPRWVHPGCCSLLPLRMAAREPLRR
jgi:hypothetical protein